MTDRRSAQAYIPFYAVHSSDNHCSHILEEDGACQCSGADLETAQGCQLAKPVMRFYSSPPVLYSPQNSWLPRPDSDLCKRSGPAD